MGNSTQKSRKSAKVKHLEDSIRTDVKRYALLRSRKEAIEDEMQQIKCRLSDYLDGLGVDSLEDRYWKMSSSTVKRVTIPKDQFIAVYGEQSLEKVSRTSKVTYFSVTRKK